MIPAEHLAEAERLLAEMHDANDGFYTPSNNYRASAALAHAVIAAAAELGVPHSEITAGGGPGETQATAS